MIKHRPFMIVSTLLVAASLFFAQYVYVNAIQSIAVTNQTESDTLVTVRKTYIVAGQAVAQSSYSRDVATAPDDESGRANETLHFIYSDHLGSANTLVDASSGEQTDTRFFPFGGIRVGGEQLGDLTERGFTGHHENRDIGLTYMNARYYVPEIGRFASADTIVPDPNMPQSFNRYSYVLNDPINYSDPSGHEPCDVRDCPLEPLPPSYIDMTVRNGKGAIVAENAVLTHNHFNENNRALTLIDINGNITRVPRSEFVIYTGPLLEEMEGAVSLIIFADPKFTKDQISTLSSGAEIDTGTRVFQSVQVGGPKGLHESLTTGYTDNVTNTSGDQYSYLQIQPDLTVGGDSGGPLYSENGDVIGVNNSGSGNYGFITDVNIIYQIINTFTNDPNVTISPGESGFR